MALVIWLISPSRRQSGTETPHLLCVRFSSLSQVYTEVFKWLSYGRSTFGKVCASQYTNLHRRRQELTGLSTNTWHYIENACRILEVCMGYHKNMKYPNSFFMMCMSIIKISEYLQYPYFSIQVIKNYVLASFLPIWRYTIFKCINDAAKIS